MASLIGFVKRVAHNVAQDVHNVQHGASNVAQRAVAQANPFDNGATWQNPQPQQQAPRPAPQRPQQAPLAVARPQQNIVIQQPQPQKPQTLLAPAVHTAAPVNLNVGNTVIKPNPVARTGAQLPTPAPNLMQHVAQDIGSRVSHDVTAIKGGIGIGQRQLLQPAVHAAAEIPASLTNKTFQPSGRVQTALLGSQPVKPVQADIKGVYQAVKAGHQNLPGGLPISPKLAAPFAVADAALHVAQDAPIVGGAIKGLTKGVKAVAPAAQTVAKEAAPIAKQATSLTPRTTLNDQLTLQDLSNHLSGSKPLTGSTLSNTLAKSADIAQKHGVDITSGPAATRLEGVNTVLDNLQNKGRLQAQTGAVGKDVTGAGQPTDPLATLKQEALKYKSADEFVNSHSPVYHGTNADLKDISQLQSGRQRGEYTNGTRSIFASENPELASKYGKNVLEGRNTGKVLDTTKLGDLHDPNKLVVPKEFSDYKTSPMLDATDRRVLENSYFKGGTPSNIIIDHKPNIQEYFRSKGYSAIQIPRGSDVSGPATEMSIIDHSKIQSRQQLTDLYNQAHAEANQGASSGSAIPKTPQTGSIKTPPLQSAKTSRASLPTPGTTAIETPKTRINTPSVSGTNTAKTTIPRVGKTSIPNNTLPTLVVNTRGFTQSVRGSQNFTPQLKRAINPSKDAASTYSAATDQQAIANTQALMNQGVDAAHGNVLTRLQSTARPDKQLITDAGTVMQHLDSQGRTAEAQNIHDLLSEHLTNSGQTSQAASLLLRRSPDGIYHKAVSDLTKAKVEVTPTIDQQLQGLRENIRKTAPDSAERDNAVQDMKQFVSKNLPSSLKDKAFTLWRTGLLTGPQTFTKVGLSHAVMNVMEKAKDLPAVAIDKAISPITGMRSTALTGRGLVSGVKPGMQAGIKLMRTGKDTAGTGGFSDTAAGMLGHTDVNYGNSRLGKATQTLTGGKLGGGRILNFYTQKIGQAHAVIPKAFFTSAQANDLFKQGIAAAKTAGLKGDAKTKFVQDFINHATEDAKGEAAHAAQHATFQQTTALGRQAKALQKVPGGKVAAPFAHIASAILTDSMDYSPIGAGKAVFQALKDRGAEGWTPTIQKHFVEELGRSITGTGAVATGAMLYKHGLLTLGYPTDPTTQAQWKAQGKQPDSIKIGNKWRQTASLGPIGTVLAAGGYSAEAGQTKTKGGKQVSQAMAAAQGLLTNVTGQSYLSGLTEAAGALQNPQQGAGKWAKSMAGSVVPIAVGTVAKATDPNQRQASGVVDTVKSKIPGLRETLPTQVTPYGQPAKREGGVLTNLFDPTRPTTSVNDPVANELARLSASVGTAGNGIPMDVKSFTATGPNGKDTITPNGAQKNQISQNSVPQIHAIQQKILSDPRYKNLSDEQKNQILNYATTDYQTVAKAKLASTINGGEQVKLTKDQKAILSGGSVDYFNKLNSRNAAPRASASTKAAALNDTPDAQYKAFLNTYNAKKSTYNPAQLAKANAELKRLQTGSTFDKTIRDTYTLSAAGRQQVINSSKNPDQIKQKLLEYDQALYNAGVNTKLKFGDGTPKTQVSKVTNDTSPAAAAANKYGIPTNIFNALIRQESGGRQSAVSPVGAIGLTQLMPATAKALGVNPNDPIQNLDGGAKYLAAQYAKFGSWDKALAAYNAGPGAVQQYGGIPPYTETQNYVKNILAMAGQGGGLAGLNFSSSGGSSGGTRSVSSGTRSTSTRTRSTSGTTRRASTARASTPKPRLVFPKLAKTPKIKAPHIKVAKVSTRLTPPKLPAYHRPKAVKLA